MPNNLTPKQDLAGFIQQEQASGAAEQDPYGYAMAVIGTTLAFALSDGVEGAMSHREAINLIRLAHDIAARDPMSYDQFIKE